MTSPSSTDSNEVLVSPRPSSASPGKRAVNLTLNAGLVSQAKSYTADLSVTEEAFLTDHAVTQQPVEPVHQQHANGWCAEWNTVHSSVGSYADEHSTL